MKALLVILLVSVTALAQQSISSEKADDCSKANLLLAVQKAARQLPDESSRDLVTFAGVYGTSLPDKYAGKSSVERLKAMAADKEKEAKEARALADREETRARDIEFVKRLAAKCTAGK